MKTTSYITLFLASMVALSAETIAIWTFETTIPTTSGPLTPEVGAGSAVGSTGGTWSNPVGNGTVESWSSNNWDVGEYVQFSVDGTGFSSFDISWSQISSSTGPGDFSLSYSVDGSLFTSVYTYDVLVNAAPNTWGSSVGVVAAVYGQTIDLGEVATGTIFFRMASTSTVSAGGGVVAATGTSRFDTVSISGAAIPEPSTYAAILGAVALAGVATRRRRV